MDYFGEQLILFINAAVLAATPLLFGTLGESLTEKSGNLNPIAMILISLFLALLKKGSNTIQTNYKIPLSVCEILTGLILFFMLACEFFLNYRLVFRHRREA